MTRVRMVTVLTVLAVAVAIGCQSVATTSMKLRNQEGNYEMALKLGREALAANPNDPEAHFQFGVAYSFLDSVALAYEHFTKAKQLDPKKIKDADNNIQHNFAKHYKLGQSAFTRQDMQTAATEFGLAAQADPTQGVAYYNLGVAYSRLADEDSTYHDKALEAADKVLELTNPNEANYTKALQLAGRELVELGREEEAVNRFQRLVDEDPASFQVIEDIGNDLVNAEQWKGAAIFLKMAADARTKVGSEDFNTYYNIGVAEYNLRKEDPTHASEAVTWYEKALELQPDDPTTLFNIVISYSFLEDWANAALWGEKYASVSPGDYRAWQLLARAYRELGENDKAKDAMGRYEQLRSAQQ